MVIAAAPRIKQVFIQAHLDEAVYMRLPADCGYISGESSCCNVLCTDSYRLVDIGVCGLLSRVLLQKSGMGQRKADPCVLCKVVDEEVTLIVCVHVDDLAVTAKDKARFDAFYAQLKEEFPVNDKGDLSWYLG